MAVRLNRLHSDMVKSKIQTSQLINRLQAHALGEIELKTSQVRSAIALLKKTLPDLQSIEGVFEHQILKHEEMLAALDEQPEAHADDDTTAGHDGAGDPHPSQAA